MPRLSRPVLFPGAIGEELHVKSCLAWFEEQQLDKRLVFSFMDEPIPIDLPCLQPYRAREVRRFYRKMALLYLEDNNLHRTPDTWPVLDKMTLWSLVGRVNKEIIQHSSEGEEQDARVVAGFWDEADLPLPSLPGPNTRSVATQYRHWIYWKRLEGTPGTVMLWVAFYALLAIAALSLK